MTKRERQLAGECLCGAVKYEVHGELGDVLNCHCSECRKWHGSAFRTRVPVRKVDFNWISGKENIAEYLGLPTVVKTFCKICGSNLISYYKDNDEYIGLPLGGVEGDFSERPTKHIFVESKASWYQITDDLPQYAGFPDDVSRIHGEKKG